MQSAANDQQLQFKFKSAGRFLDLYVIYCFIIFFTLFICLILFILLLFLGSRGRIGNELSVIFMMGVVFIFFFTIISSLIGAAISYPFSRLTYSVELRFDGIVMTSGLMTYVIPYEHVIDVNPEEIRSFFKLNRMGRWSSRMPTSKVVWLTLSSLEGLPLMSKFYSRNDKRVALDVDDPQGFCNAYQFMQQMRMHSLAHIPQVPFYMPPIPLMSERRDRR